MSGAEAFAGPSSAEPEQASVASPCLTTPDAATELTLPQPLSLGDAALLRQILDDQTRGNVVTAARAAAGLRDRSFAETMLGPRAAPPDWPEVAKPAAADKERNPGSDRAERRNPALEAAIDRLAEQAAPSAALDLIARATGRDDVEAGFLRAHLARSLLAADRDLEALRVASSSLGSGVQDRHRGAAALVAGLAAWGLERIGRAQAYFIEAAEAPLASDPVRAAAAFWASRTAKRLQGVEAQQVWLRRAASSSSSFYGLIARRMLGLDLASRPTVYQADIDALASFPAGRRAFAWLQLGQAKRAEAEFRWLRPALQSNPPLRRALLWVARRTHLTMLAERLASLERDRFCAQVEDAHLPPLPLHPAGGFRVDPALVYAITRTESNFDIGAVSAAGARGLMQIMPMTAKSVMGHMRLTEALLRNPAFNLSLGQQVLVSMARRPAVDGDLIRALVAYNAGVGTVARWGAASAGARDPLLMIEAIPIKETRAFVQRVLAHSWLYAVKLGMPSPSLDDLAAGRFPRLAPPLAERRVASLMP